MGQPEIPSALLIYAGTFLMAAMTFLLGVIGYFLKAQFDTLSEHTKQIVALDKTLVQVKADLEALALVDNGGAADLRELAATLHAQIAELKVTNVLYSDRFHAIANRLQSILFLANMNGWKLPKSFQLPGRTNKNEDSDG
jgi:hypothetical protein